jgi:hypothetical protein
MKDQITGEFPGKINSEEELEELLSRPREKVISMFSKLEGDIIFLGIGGKIGLSLASMAKRAVDNAGLSKRIIGVSQFHSEEQRKKIENSGIETIAGNLLDIDFVKSLPAVKNVFFMAGMKFGSVDKLSFTWAVNSLIPALVGEHFKQSRIVAFSTGCVYPFMPVESGGSLETDAPAPIGEYAQSCLGRERMFEYGSMKNETAVMIIRLNYAVELRYGVLVDIALKVRNKEAVDLDMGYFNAIWQGDMNDFVLRSIEYASSPARILNITGPEIVSVREVAEEFGKQFDVGVKYKGAEAKTALLSNSAQAFGLIDPPKVPINLVIQWIADWIKGNGKLLGKPTHYEVRDGRY